MLPRILPAVLLVATVLTGCAGGASVADVARGTGAVADVERTGAPATTASPTAPTTTAGASDREDQVLALHQASAFPGANRTQLECVVDALFAAFGPARGVEVVDLYLDDEAGIGHDEAETFGTAFGTCLDERAVLRRLVERSASAFSSEVDCIVTGLPEVDIQRYVAWMMLAEDETDPSQRAAANAVFSAVGRCLSPTRVEDRIARSTLEGDGVTAEQAGCYAARRVKDVGPETAYRTEFGTDHTLAEATALIDAFTACIDLRAFVEIGIAGGDPIGPARCLVGRLSDADLHALVLNWWFGIDAGRSLTAAYEHYDAAERTCTPTGGA